MKKKKRTKSEFLIPIFFRPEETNSVAILVPHLTTHMRMFAYSILIDGDHAVASQQSLISIISFSSRSCTYWYSRMNEWTKWNGKKFVSSVDTELMIDSNRMNLAVDRWCRIEKVFSLMSLFSNIHHSLWSISFFFQISVRFVHAVFYCTCC